MNATHLLFIDDRPCNRRRPCSFNDAMLARADVLPILVRFPDTFAELSAEYLARTRHLPAFMIEPTRRVEEEAERLRAFCDARGLHPQWFCCMSEPQQELGHALARALGLPALPGDTVHALRDKRAMKRRLRGAGLRTAGFATVRSVDELAAFGVCNGFPCVLKPVDGWGTLDTVRVDGPADAAGQRERLRRRVEMMAETWVDDEELECCALVHDGEVLDAFASRMPSRPLQIASQGAINANISLGPYTAARGVDFRGVSQRVVDAFGLRSGYLHMELFAPAGGGEPTIGELALRYPGCEIAKNHGLAHGFDIAGATLELYLGRRPELRYTRSRCVGDLLLPYAVGHVVEHTPASVLERLPGVLGVHLGVRAGEVLPARPASSFECSGWVFVEGDSPAQVEARMHEVLRCFRLRTEPVALAS